MTTVLQYLMIAAVIGAVVFGIAVFIFGRGEQLAPLSPRTSPTELPDEAMTGADVRRVRFPMALRGYRMSDVDWALERMADELDRLRTDVSGTPGELVSVAPPDGLRLSAVDSVIGVSRRDSSGRQSVDDRHRRRPSDDLQPADPGTADSQPAGPHPGDSETADLQPADTEKADLQAADLESTGGNSTMPTGART